MFLDEPTTGLDVQSRTALWDEVSGLARREGVTVFLTTQYLEEADALADRVGIIDRGRLVAEGTPAALKAQIGRPTLEAVPVEAHQVDRLEEVLADVVRRLDSEGIKVADLQLHAPSLDDVFLAKTGRSLEGAGGAPRAEEETGKHPAEAATP